MDTVPSPAPLPEAAPPGRGSAGRPGRRGALPLYRLFWPETLKGRIVLAAALIFCLGGLGITLVAAQRLHRDMADVLSQQQLATTTYIARDIGSKLSLRMEGLKKVASNIPPSLLADRPALQRWLEDRRAIHTLFPTGLIVVPADGGAALAETPVLPTRPKSYTDRDWFIGAVTTRQPYFSKPLVTRATKEPALVVAVPLHDAAGKLLAVIAGITPLKTPGFLDQITDARPGQEGSYELLDLRHRQFVLDSNQLLTLAPLPSPGEDALHDRIVAGQRGVASLLNREGVEELVASVDIPVVGWTLVARLPQVEAFQPVGNAVRNIVVMAAAIGIPLILLLLLVLHRLMQPLEEVAAKLYDMAEGHRAMRPLPVSRCEEVARVAGGFNRLQAKLLAQEERLAALARHDPLTGLANREPLNERLACELLRFGASRKTLALLFLDLDGFKPVNDTYGHDVGDRLLCEVAERLRACVRDTDMVARHGGDEFLILLSEVGGEGHGAERVAQSCLDALARPFLLGEHTIRIGVSIGIASLLPGDAVPESVATLIRRADAAMYQAKGEGRNRYRVARNSREVEPSNASPSDRVAAVSSV